MPLTINRSRLKEISDRLLAAKTKKWFLDPNPVETQRDKLAAFFIYLLSDESIFLPYLADLNHRIADLAKAVTLPAAPTKRHLIGTVYYPEPPSTEFNKGKRLINALETVLLEQEQKHGVNLNRHIETVAEFIGPIPQYAADEFVTLGSLWNDEHFSVPGLYHSRYAHRMQHYVLTRLLEDYPEWFNGLFPSDDRQVIFKHFVNPQTQGYCFMFDNGYFTRSYWHLVVDNNPEAPFGYFVTTPSITGPSQLMEIAMSAYAFQETPHLAHSLYFSFCQPLFYLADRLSASPLRILGIYSEAYKNKGTTSLPLANNMAEELRSYNQQRENDPNLTKFAELPTRYGIRFIRAPALTSQLASFISVNNKRFIAILNKYKMTPTNDMAADLKRALRSAASNGRHDDLTELLTTFKVNVNAQDNNPITRRTALHWAVIKLNESQDKSELLNYRTCVTVLLKHHADLSIRDAAGKKPADYDENGLLMTELASDNSASTIHRKLA